MAILTADCPRCSSKIMTFNVFSAALIDTRRLTGPRGAGKQEKIFEIFSICRKCRRSTVFVSGTQNDIISRASWWKEDISLNDFFKFDYYISQKDMRSRTPPDYLPQQIRECFEEAAACFSISCWNAAAAMFRKCLDLASIAHLPNDLDEKTKKQLSNNLASRLSFLFEKRILPIRLERLSFCIRKDGNFGVHAGSLQSDEAADIQDFTTLMLEALYTEPHKIKIAYERSNARKQKKDVES